MDFSNPLSKPPFAHFISLTPRHLSHPQSGDGTLASESGELSGESSYHRIPLKRFPRTHGSVKRSGGGSLQSPLKSWRATNPSFSQSYGFTESYLLSSTSQFIGMDFPPGLDVDFLLAARGGDIRRLQSIVAEYENVPFANVTSPDGGNALHWAAMEGKTSICRFLIEVLKFNINGTNENGETPLFLALMRKHRPTTIFLVDNGADVTHRNTLGDTPLHYVADRGNKEMIKLLISKGADICATSQRGMPLHFAAKGGNPDVLEYILNLTADVGADPNYQCYQVTPLRFAATEGDERLIRCLLEASADPNIPDSVGYTPLDHAALLCRREVVELLFPLTSRIASYPDWSVNGIMQHAKSREARMLFKSRQKEVALLGKTKGKEAFERKEYCDAYNWFTQAAEANPLDAKVIANRSLLAAKCNYSPIALREAQKCIKLEPSWAKAHFREGAAYMLLKSFEKAAKSFSRALALEPGNKEIEKAHRAALADAIKFSHWSTE